MVPQLPEMTSLEILDLMENGISGAARATALHRPLIEGRVRLASLIHLDLERNFLECAGASEVAQVLPGMPNIEALDLTSNAIADAYVGKSELVRRLVHMPLLRRVVLDFIIMHHDDWGHGRLRLRFEGVVGGAYRRAHSRMLVMHMYIPCTGMYTTVWSTMPSATEVLWYL